MFDSSSLAALFVLVATVTLVLRFAIFRVSCTLTEAGEPGAIRSILLVAVAAALVVACASLAGYLFPAPSDETLSRVIVIRGLAIVVASGLAAVVYAFFLPTSLRRGAILAGAELLLGVLFASLVGGVILVAMAGMQLRRRPEPPQVPTTASAFLQRTSIS
jgi:hypothetical protein